MQAIIMAAGFGSRLGDLTGGNPKSFLEINGESLIERAIRLLQERGIEDIHVVTGHQHELMEAKISAGATCHYNPLYFCTNVLASFSVAQHALNNSFIFLHADTIFESTILDKLLKADGEIVLPVDFKKVQEEEMKVIVDDSHRVITLSKEIPLNLAQGEFIGLAKVSAKILQDLSIAVYEELKDKKLVQSYFEGALQNLIDKGHQIQSIDISKYKWIEIDFPEDFEMAKEMSTYF